MTVDDSVESVDAIRQILFGQEKRQLDDKIHALQVKLDSFQQAHNQFNLELNEKLSSESLGVQNTLKSLTNQIDDLDIALKRSEHQLSAQIKELGEKLTNNQNVELEEIKKQALQRDNGFNNSLNSLEATLTKNHVKRAQLATIFMAISSHFETDKS